MAYAYVCSRCVEAISSSSQSGLTWLPADASISITKSLKTVPSQVNLEIPRGLPSLHLVAKVEAWASACKLSGRGMSSGRGLDKDMPGSPSS
jgi:hypothetical protein